MKNMSHYRKIRWYRIGVTKRLGTLEGEELISEVNEIIEDIRKKKLDKNGMFKLLIKQLERMAEEARYKPKQKGRIFDPFHIPRSGDGRGPRIRSGRRVPQLPPGWRPRPLP